jgi:multiple sugar transport system ATP-binding protein
MATLSLCEIWKVYGEVDAVVGMSLDIMDHEFVALLGPSGAGKTSALRMIAGLEIVSAGSIKIDGQRVNELPPEQRDVAMVFETYALYPHLTVYENLQFPLRSRARKKKFSEQEMKARINDVACMLEIDYLLDRKPSQLSGGQRQRVSLGRALVREPKVMLMDEPIAHLDAKLRHMLRGELKRMQKDSGVTTVYATPDYQEAMAMADRVAVLKEGEIHQVGTPDEIYNLPINEVVALLVGEPPMIIVDAWLDKSGDGDTLLTPLFKTSISDDIKSKLIATSKERFRFGIRPTDVGITRNQTECSIPAVVDIVEPLGLKEIVTVKLGDALLKLKSSTRLGLKDRERVWLRIDPAKGHFFDAGSGKRLL